MKRISLILIIAVVLITCEKDDPDPCNCLATYGTTAHLGISETCACGGKPCNCTEQTATVGGITVRKQAGVTVQQMNTAVANINNMYSWLSTIEQGKLATKITVIHIVTGSGVIQKGTVLEVGFDADDESIADYVIVNVIA